MSKEKEESSKERQGPRFRIDIALIIAFFIMVVSFAAYMINTDLEDVLEEEYGSSIVTHDYSFDSAREQPE